MIHNRYPTRKNRGQQGFTLIEILVAMALSLLVIGMVGGVFLGSRESHDVQDEISQLQENIRVSSSLLRRVTFHAGHVTQPSLSNASVVQFGNPGVGVLGEVGTSKLADQQDWFQISYQGDGLPGSPSGIITDCLGVAIGIGTTVTNVRLIAPSTNRFQVRSIGGRNWLACSLDSGTTWQPLVPDVEAMEVSYGVDPDANGSIDSYETAAAVADWRFVNAVRISLLFRTNRPIATQADTRTYMVGATTYGPFNDKFIRRNLTITAAIRNRLTQ
jgi:type IV pilus assembly protein PilW